MAKKDKELVSTEPVTDLAELKDMDWGDGGISSEDIIIPSLRLMQHTSQLVKDQTAKFGEVRDSMNNKVFATMGEACEIIPFYYQKMWIEFELLHTRSGTEKKYVQTVPFCDDQKSEHYNANWAVQTEDTERDLVWDVFVLFPQDVANGKAFPYSIRFARTGAMAAKKLLTQMYVRNRSEGLPPAGVVCDLMVTHRESPKGDYAAFDVAGKRESEVVEMQAAYKWLCAIRGKQAIVHSTEEV